MRLKLSEPVEGTIAFRVINNHSCAIYYDKISFGHLFAALAFAPGSLLSIPAWLLLLAYLDGRICLASLRLLFFSGLELFAQFSLQCLFVLRFNINYF